MLPKILAGTMILASLVLEGPLQATAPAISEEPLQHRGREACRPVLLAQQGAPGPAGASPLTGAPAPTMAPVGVSPATQAGSAAPAPLERRTLKLEPADLTWDTPPGMVTYAPGRQVMSARYDTYIIDRKSLEAAVGRGLKDPVSILVEITSTEVRTHTPSDPLLPSPQGGFVYTTYKARVISKIP